MKKSLLITLAMSVIIGATCSAASETTNLYPMAGAVVALNYEEDTVTIEDCNGNLWDFYGTDDYYEGDFVALVMDDNRTKENIYDDIIVSAKYTGYWMED